MYTLNVVASGKANRGSKTVDEYIIVMGHGCHFNWDVDYCIFKYVLHSAALANHEGSALPLAELRREPCTVLWGAGGGGLPISSALSHSTSVVSRTSGWAEQHSIHGYSILQMTLLHRGEGGGKKRTSAAREKRIEPRMKRDWNGRKSTGVRVGNERSKHRCLPEDHCSCTKSGAVRPTLSKAVSERSEGTDGEKVWELITSLWTSRDGNPGSFSGSRSNFTQKKCLRFPSLNLTHKRSEENSQNKSSPAGSWKVRPHTATVTTALLSTAQLLSSSQVPPRSSLTPACSRWMSSLHALPLLGSWTHSWSMPREGTWNVWLSS